MNTDQVEGKVKELGAQARQGIAKVTGDKKAQAHGAADEATGKIQKTYGDVKEKIKDAAK